MTEPDPPVGVRPPMGRAPMGAGLRARVRALTLVGIGLLTGVLVLAHLWPNTYRETGTFEVLVAWAAFIIRNLGFHISIAIIMLIIALLAIRAWLRAAATVPALAICLIPVSGHALTTPTEPIAGETLRVMTFNVLGTNRAHDRVAGEVLRQQPDLLLVQESNNVWHKALLLRLGERYAHVARLEWNEWIGMSVFSTREIRTPTRVLEGHGRDALRFEVMIDDEPVVVYAIHPPHPVSLANVRSARHLFAALRDAVRAEIAGGRRVMIMGDCNWGHLSPQHADLRREGFKDAFDLARRGGRMTWPTIGRRHHLLGFQIDHVYLGPGLTSNAAWRGESSGSDHRPVVACVGLSSTG